MFKRNVKPISELVLRTLRVQGLETPLLQKRLIDSWPAVVGEVVARYTQRVDIRNQTLYVSLSSPALRAELSMRRQQLVQQLNAQVGSQVIVDIRFN